MELWGRKWIFVRRRDKIMERASKLLWQKIVRWLIILEGMFQRRNTTLTWNEKGLEYARIGTIIMGAVGIQGQRRRKDAFEGGEIVGW
jgi:hypothetical protein